MDQKNGTLYFSLDYPDNWSYAKISLIDSGSGKVTTTSITPSQTGFLPAYEKGQYWILAQITSSNKTDEAYQTVLVNETAQRSIFDFQDIGIPQKQFVIILGIIVMISIVGLVARRKKN